MANHKQSKKRVRQTITKAARNRHFRTTMRTYVKRVRAALLTGDGSAAKEGLGIAVKTLDKAVTKGILHRKTASRTISRLTVAVKKLD